MARRKETGLYKQPGSPYWYISYTDPKTGKQVRVSSKTTVKELAAQKRAQLYNDAYKREHFKEPVSWTVRELVEWAWENHWSLPLKAKAPDKVARAHRIKMSNLKAVLAWFGDRIAAKVSVQEIQTFIAERVKTANLATINRELDDLRSVYNKAIKTDGMLSNNPFASVPSFDTSENRRFRVATPEERLALIKQAKVYQPLIEFAFHTGLRQSEICKLKWSDIDFERSRMKILSNKRRGSGQVTRWLPIFRSAREILQNTPRLHDSVFLGMTGKPIYPRSLQDAFFRLTRRLKIPNFRFHDIRHTFATEYYRRTKNIAALSYILGHTSIETTMIYLNLSHADLLPTDNFDVYNDSQHNRIIVNGAAPAIPQTTLTESTLTVI